MKNRANTKDISGLAGALLKYPLLFLIRAYLNLAGDVGGR